MAGVKTIKECREELINALAEVLAGEDVYGYTIDLARDTVERLDEVGNILLVKELPAGYINIKIRVLKKD